MSPLFGHKDDDGDDKQGQLDTWRQSAEAEIERLSALPLPALAAEVMTKGFGPGGPGADDDKISLGQANISAGPTASDISYELVPASSARFPGEEELQLRQRVAKLAAEGLQQLEHASLVRAQLHTSMGEFDWAATRRGRAAIEQDQVTAILGTVAH